MIQYCTCTMSSMIYVQYVKTIFLCNKLSNCQKIIFNFFFNILHFFTYFVYENFFTQNLCTTAPVKCLRNRSPDSVQSGKFGCTVLSGQETSMPSPV